MSLVDDTRAYSLDLAGEYDVANAQDLLRAVLDVLPHEPSTVALDLSRVTFFGSSALGALITAQRACRQSGAQMIIAEASPAVRRILAITHTQRLFGLLSDGRP